MTISRTSLALLGLPFYSSDDNSHRQNPNWQRACTHLRAFIFNTASNPNAPASWIGPRSKTSPQPYPIRAPHWNPLPEWEKNSTKINITQKRRLSPKQLHCKKWNLRGCGWGERRRPPMVTAEEVQWCGGEWCSHGSTLCSHQLRGERHQLCIRIAGIRPRLLSLHIALSFPVPTIPTIRNQGSLE
jgi:hypothetical protein